MVVKDHWYERVIQERSALDLRRESLERVIADKAFLNFNKAQQNLLMAQAKAMMMYSHVLTIRLVEWENDNE